MKRATVIAATPAARTINCTLLGGATLTAQCIGVVPAVDAIVLVDEVGPGSWVCTGILSGSAHQSYLVADGLTFFNFTLGNGSVRSSYYTVDASYVEFEGDILLGSTSAFTGDVLVSLPVNSINDGALHAAGIAEAIDASAGFARVVGVVEVIVGTFGQVLHFASNALSGWTAAAPFTWAVNDNFTWHVRYRWI